MAEQAAQRAVLRQTFTELGRGVSDRLYLLPPDRDVLIGRDLHCQIVLDSALYSGVSRQHALLRCPTNASIDWQIGDLNSRNGTFVNDKQIQSWYPLQHGDRIVLGKSGPQFIFEVQVEASSATNPSTHNSSHYPSTLDRLTLSHLFPILSNTSEVQRSAYLVPGVITVVFVVLLFVSVGNPTLFNGLLATYLAGAAYFVVYQLCGKPKPWWVIAGVAIATPLLILSPVMPLFLWFFRDVLPGNFTQTNGSTNLLLATVQMFFGAGLMEELLKALPVLFCWWLGWRVQAPLRYQIGIWEPLDGILLGTASAVGFTLLETIGQYVPSFMVNVSLQSGAQMGAVAGLQLLIARILGAIAGHLAYSGYLGYAIGLSVLKPSKRWQILGTGYLTAATLHTLWNVSGLVNLLALAIVGSLSYAFLIAAILKARSIAGKR
jgi:RsiW-degrading membrane proteinase PrsW (M82 family)